MAFKRPLQSSLNEFRETYNDHVIRRQKNVNLPTGYSPNIMYENPELFGKGMSVEYLTL